MGEQFTAVLSLESQAALRSAPAQLGFDPRVLQVVAVREGDYFKQAGGQTRFSQRIDPGQGKVFVTAERLGQSGVRGTGELLSITFRATKAQPSAGIQLLSISPEPSPERAMALPVEHVIRIAP